MLDLLKLEELDEPKLNSYFKGSMTVRQSSLDFILIIPLSYPNMDSKVIVTSLMRRKEEERKILGLEGLECEGDATPPLQKIFSMEMAGLEQQLNRKIEEFVGGAENGAFRALLQMNRMISLLGLTALK